MSQREYIHWIDILRDDGQYLLTAPTQKWKTKKLFWLLPHYRYWPVMVNGRYRFSSFSDICCNNVQSHWLVSCGAANSLPPQFHKRRSFASSCLRLNYDAKFFCFIQKRDGEWLPLFAERKKTKIFGSVMNPWFMVPNKIKKGQTSYGWRGGGGLFGTNM